MLGGTWRVLRRVAGQVPRCTEDGPQYFACLLLEDEAGDPARNIRADGLDEKGRVPFASEGGISEPGSAISEARESAVLQRHRAMCTTA